jgi:flagellin
MSLSILNNVAALYAQNNLNTTQSALQNTLQQLSSGSRINSGADDASGLSVADGLHANVAALAQSAQNASAGIGLLQTADGSLSQVTNLLDRAVTLATEAANGTLTDTQVSSANQEYQNILTQIANIGSTTNYNSSKVFSGTAKNIVVSDGTSNGLNVYADTVGILTKGSVGLTAPAITPGTSSAISNATPSASSSSAASVAKFAAIANGSSYGGSLSVKVGSGLTSTVAITAGSSLDQVVTQLNTRFTADSVSVTASVGTGADAGKLILTGPVGASSDLDLTGTALTATTAATTAATPGPGADFTAAGVSTLTYDTAQTVLTTVTSAIADVAYQRGSLGANINELTSASNVASAESVNLTSAEQNIRATNYGQAASDLSKYQILSQTGISALAQANSVQQEVLKLLQ